MPEETPSPRKHWVSLIHGDALCHFCGDTPRKAMEKADLFRKHTPHTILVPPGNPLQYGHSRTER